MLMFIQRVSSQDYDVADIDCSYGVERSERDGDRVSGSRRDGGGESVSARLKKPDGFRGTPIFADDRLTNPLVSSKCQIRPDKSDKTGSVTTGDNREYT